MTLSQDDLTGALHDGLKASAKCSDTFCRTTATIENEGYLLAHNGTGSRDTDVQRVHNTTVLGKSREQLAAQIKTWVLALHDPKATRIDLNAAMAETRGPAAVGWPWRADHVGHVEQGA